jgi:hypothetical protein
MNFLNDIKCVGRVEAFIEYASGKKIDISFDNTVLTLGKVALAKTLANDVGTYGNYFVNRMVFGNGGTYSGEPRLVSPSRAGLFGVTVANKPVVATVNPDNQTQAIFTSTLAYSDANGYSLNEMALVLNNGDFYSMVTFPDLSKTSSMQIIFNWNINLV